MDGFFSFFGKVTIVILVLGVMVGTGYYMGTGKFPLFTNPAPEAVTTTAPVTSSAPTPTTPPKKIIKGGVASGLSFGLYTIEVPDAWTVKQQHEDEPSPMDTLTLSQGPYILKIYQAATGGAMCLYPGDPDFEGPSSRYDTFVQISTKDGVMLRRGGKAGGFTICQKGTDTYGLPTSFGHISYTTPVSPDETIIKEMDGIIATLNKV